MTKFEFNNILWPKEFFIEYVGGEIQSFVSEQGVIWDSGNNEIGENENRKNISCAWKKKSPSQQRYKLIQVWVDEIQSIQTTNGMKLWAKNT